LSALAINILAVLCAMSRIDRSAWGALDLGLAEYSGVDGGLH
jgi:hypothetical protein